MHGSGEEDREKTRRWAVKRVSLGSELDNRNGRRTCEKKGRTTGQSRMYVGQVNDKG
jgi:hypothetical protein